MAAMTQSLNFLIITFSDRRHKIKDTEYNSSKHSLGLDYYYYLCECNFDMLQIF